MSRAPKDVAEFLQMMKDERARARAAAIQFADVMAGNGSGLLGNVIRELELTGAFPSAFRRARFLDVSPSMRLEFLSFWVRGGDTMRDEVRSDLILINGLKAMLPRHQGTQPVTLYRGESTFTWRRRRYGMSWTKDLAIAESFARLNQKMTEAGGVVLSVVAPPESIICVPGLWGGDYDYGEDEYLVDRRLIPCPTLVERLPHVELELS